MKKKILSILTLLLVTILVACGPTVDDHEDDNDDDKPVSVSLTIDSSTFEVGTHTLTAEVLPAEADQSVIFSLVGFYEDITLEDNKLTITSNVIDGSSVTIKVISAQNPLISDQKTFTISNPTPPPIEISTEEQLRNINLRNNYVLVNDIELTEIWIPLGIPENEDAGIPGEGFSGTFDGQGFKITNITTGPGGYNKGFFNLIETHGVVKNVGFESGMGPEDGIKAQAWSAVVAGSNHGLISNVYTNVRMEVAGVPGASLVGSNYGTIEYSYTIGPVITGSGAHGSGIANSGSEGNIISSFVLDTSVNAAIGYNKQQDPNIQKSENWMKSKQNYIDAGWDEDIWYLSDGHYPILRNSEFVEPEPEIFIYITNSEEFINYNNPEERQLQITYQLSNTDNLAVTFELLEPKLGVTLSEDGLITLSGDVLDNTEFTVRVTSVADDTKFDEKTFIVNNPDGSSYIEISSLDELIALANSNNPADMSKNYILTNDIDLGSAWWNKDIGRGFEDGFNGIFDGNGYSLFNWAGGDGQNAFGIFHHIGQFGIVRNLNIELRAQRMYVNAESAVLTHKNDGLIENIKLQGELMSLTSNLAGVAYFNNGTIKNVISLVKLLPNESSSNHSTIGGIVFENTGTILHAYVDGDVTGIEQLTKDPNPALDSYVVSTAFLQNELTYDIFDEDIWRLEAGMYPELISDTAVIPTDTIYITTEAELRALQQDQTLQSLSLTYILMNDIYLTEETEGSGMYWTTPIGSDTLRFNGVFDGNGFTIYNVKNAYNTNANFGFFGYIGENGIVQNLILDTNGTLHTGTNSAVFAQYNYGLIQNVMTFGEIENTVGSRYVSGFIRQNNGVIKNAIASVIISHDETDRVRGAFAVSTSGTGSFENAIYNAEVAGSSQMEGVSTGPLKFYPSGSNNDYIVDYDTNYFKDALNFEDWDSSIWLIVDGEHITLQPNITK